MSHAFPFRCWPHWAIQRPLIRRLLFALIAALLATVAAWPSSTYAAPPEASPPALAERPAASGVSYTDFSYTVRRGDTASHSTSRCTYYTVRHGDGLLKIARRYGVNAYTIARANGLYDLNHIYTGQRLCIPTSYSAPAPKPKPPAAGHLYYTVRHGDKLDHIARDYGVSSHALVQVNGLRDANHIYVGQVLKIPTYQQPAPQPQPQPEPPKPQPPAPQPQPQPGGDWHAAYYANKNFEGSPVFTRRDPQVNFNWGESGPGGGVPNDGFSVRWTRDHYFEPGTYRFYVTTDDGARLFISDHLVLDAFRVQPPTSYYVDVYLSGGTHTLKVEYYEESGGAVIDVRFSRL